jgi:hypothetical protein
MYTANAGTDNVQAIQAEEGEDYGDGSYCVEAEESTIGVRIG